MALIDVQRAVRSVCLDAEPPLAALAELGEANVWLMYRELTRKRLLGEIQHALPRTCAAAGTERMEQAFREHLDRDPPRTRFFHAIVGAFADSARAQWHEQANVPAHLLDLLAYEAALWEVSDLDAALPEGSAPPCELDFERVPVVAPALRLLALEHPVHLPPSDPGSGSAAATFLAIHRAADTERVRTWTLNRSSHALLRDFALGRCTAAESVPRVAAQLGQTVTPSYVEAVCETLAQWLESGILLGSR
jgi:hypothetical protein